MAIQGFDYKGFAQNLAQQALELIPPDFNDNQKNYVANTLLNFSTVAGQALYDDESLGFNLDQAVMITQIIAEWSFHKSVDLIRSGIPQQFWDPIMQKIAYTIFEVAKNAFHQNLPQDQCLQLIEHHVKKTWVDCIEELKDKNLIDEGLKEQAEHQSNIDAMMQQQVEAEQQQQAQAAQQQQAQMQQNTTIPQTGVPASAAPLLGSGARVLKLATLAMLFRKMRQEKVQTILNKFSPDDADTVIKFMGMPDLESKVDTNTAMRCLQEIKTNLPAVGVNVTPSKVLAKIQNVSQYLDRSQIEQTLSPERQRVKRFVFSALEGDYYEMPPKVANIIATHLEDSV